MVVKNPQGHKIIDQAIAAVISGYADEALVTFPYHGLGLGDYVYIVSDIDEYNGFWYVTPVNANTFKISEYSGAPFVEYYQDADIDYYQTQEHVWNSIFLPIVYKISNDKWPVNSVDTARNITSQADDNGYTVLTLSAPTGASYLEYVEITGNVYGVYQVIEVTGSLLTINLPYDVDNTFGTAQKYYNNYQTKVKIYAGLNASHPWANKKPYELVGELSLTPDTDNITTFSVSDYIRNKIQIKNNTLLYSLPLNLDAFTGFFIETAESFDSSDNYVLYTDESEFEVDDFEGYAIAGKLPFKNVYSGDYADYVWTDGSPALWLSTLSRLLAVAGRYFDLSFILNQVISGGPGFTPSPVPPLEDWGTLNESAETTGWVLAIPNPYCIIDAGVSVGGFFDYFFTGVVAMTFEVGRTYKYSFTMGLDADISGADTMLFRIHFQVRNNAYTILDSATFDQTVFGTFSGVGSVGGEFEFVAPVGATNIGFRIEMPNGTTDSAVATMGSVTDLTESTPSTENGTFDIVLKKYISSDYYLTETVEYQSQGVGVYRIPLIPDSQYIKYCLKAQVDSVDVTEEICVDIIEECDVTSGFMPEEIRLLEDGDYRLLE